MSLFGWGLVVWYVRARRGFRVWVLRFRATVRVGFFRGVGGVLWLDVSGSCCQDRRVFRGFRSSWGLRLGGRAEDLGRLLRFEDLGVSGLGGLGRRFKTSGWDRWFQFRQVTESNIL